MKKSREGLCLQLTDGNGFAVGGLTAKKTRGGSLCILTTLGIPNFPRFSALPSAVLQLSAKRRPRGPRGFGFAVSFATAVGKACR